MDDDIVMFGTIEEKRESVLWIEVDHYFLGILYDIAGQNFLYLKDQDRIRLAGRMTHYPSQGRVQIDVPAVFYRKMIERFIEEGRPGAIDPTWHAVAIQKVKE